LNYYPIKEKSTNTQNGKLATEITRLQDNELLYSHGEPSTTNIFDYLTTIPKEPAQERGSFIMW